MLILCDEYSDSPKWDQQTKGGQLEIVGFSGGVNYARTNADRGSLVIDVSEDTSQRPFTDTDQPNRYLIEKPDWASTPRGE